MYSIKSILPLLKKLTWADATNLANFGKCYDFVLTQKLL